jgi:CHAT domain-containing protein/tetratricopeptide (TPR) repeat protein
MAEPSRNQIARALGAFLDAQTWEESKRIVEVQRDKLLTDIADQVLADLLEKYRGDANATRILEDHRDLLARCRRDGIERAFSDRVYADEVPLQTLLSEIEQLKRPSDLSRRVEVYRTALRMVKRDAQAHLWATLQNALAISLLQNPQGERAENVEQAILHFQHALQVFTPQAFPIDWAGIQNNLGNAYRQRIRGEPADNLEQAILHYQHTLEVHTRQDFPERWAGTQHNLGSAYRERIRGERDQNLEQAILHYRQALEVRTPMAFPQECRDTAYSLGRLLYDESRLSEARHALDTAHQAVEALRGEVQRDVAKRSLAEENADLYARLVSCCLLEGDEVAAFLYATGGKGRAFVDLLDTARLDLSAASANDPALADDLQRARELRQHIDALLATLTGESSSSTSGLSSTTDIELPSRTTLPPDVLRAQISSLQAQETNHWDEMAYKYPALTATQKAPVLSADQACTLAVELKATLVEYYHHAEGWCAFVVTPNAMHYIPLPLITDDLLERMVTWMLRLEYPVGRNRLSDIRLSEWHDAVIAPLEAYLPRGQSIFLAPFGALHVLPLGVARSSQTGHYITEDYQISFAPSLSALDVVWDQAHRADRERQPPPHRLLSVAYPGAPDSNHYLPNILPEAQAIASHFTQVTPLFQEEATPEAVLAQSRDQDVVHFGCHGWFDPERPDQSGLMLAGGWLTVQRVITELRLEQAYIATLAACLSGRAALQRGDEHVGLLQAMLTTGVPSVVASLWPVADAPTRALFEAFYARLVAGYPPAKALQEAARHVRAQPGWEHPYYWAAFQVSGLAHESQNPVQMPLPMNQAVRMHASMHATTRGGKLMNVERQVEGALILLAQMSEYPNEVLKELKNETERDAVLTALEALAEQAIAAQSDADLQNLTNAIYRLVKSQPGLKALLLPEEAEVAEEEAQREVTLADHLAATGQLTYAQTYAPQIRNAVIECRTQLEAALSAAEQADSTPGKSHERSQQ